VGGGSIFRKTQDVGLASYSNNLSTAKVLIKNLNLAIFGVYVDNIQNSAVGSFSLKPEGTTTKAARC
jgi:hypothetical protein